MPAKHTPGPWKYFPNVGPTKVLIVEEDGSTVVELSTRVRDSRLIANARLIAAAPELLEACKAGLHYLNTHEGGWETPIARDEMNAAIAKAEGR